MYSESETNKRTDRGTKYLNFHQTSCTAVHTQSKFFNQLIYGHFTPGRTFHYNSGRNDYCSCHLIRKMK